MRDPYVYAGLWAPKCYGYGILDNYRHSLPTTHIDLNMILVSVYAYKLPLAGLAWENRSNSSDGKDHEKINWWQGLDMYLRGI